MSGIASTGQPDGIRLAPDLTFPSSLSSSAPKAFVTIDPSGALTTILSLTGKYAIDLLGFSGLPTIEIVTIKMTVDGVVIWNDTFTPTVATINIFSADNGTTSQLGYAPFICDSSLLIEVETVADTAVSLGYYVRKIL